MIHVRLPTKEESDQARRFRVHKNYVSSIAAFLLGSYGPPDRMIANLIGEQRSLLGFHNIQSHQPADAGAAIGRFLNISWTSEYLLRGGGIGDPDSMRYTNAWAPIHAYYAVYMSMQAWFAANNIHRLVDDHTKSLRTISSMVTERSLFPLPWSVTCSGCVPLREIEIHGLPPGVDPSVPISVLSTPSDDTFWPRYAKMLETTRRRRLERNFDEWKKSRGRKSMQQPEKRSVANHLVPTTIFDFLWRLRIRSNYKDISSFMAWNISSFEHQQFHEALVAVAHTTCTLLQSLVVRKAGRSIYERSVEQFSDGELGSRRDLAFIAERRELFL